MGRYFVFLSYHYYFVFSNLGGPKLGVLQRSPQTESFWTSFSDKGSPFLRFPCSPWGIPDQGIGCPKNALSSQTQYLISATTKSNAIYQKKNPRNFFQNFFCTFSTASRCPKFQKLWITLTTFVDKLETQKNSPKNRAVGEGVAGGGDRPPCFSRFHPFSQKSAPKMLKTGLFCVFRPPSFLNRPLTF